jgi:hypothetical protein
LQFGVAVHRSSTRVTAVHALGLTAGNVYPVMPTLLLHPVATQQTGRSGLAFSDSTEIATKRQGRPECTPPSAS